MAQSPIINHILDCPVVVALGQTQTLLSGRAFQGPRDHPPVAEGRSQTSLYIRSCLHHKMRKDSHFLGGGEGLEQILSMPPTQVLTRQQYLQLDFQVFIQTRVQLPAH